MSRPPPRSLATALAFLTVAPLAACGGGGGGGGAPQVRVELDRASVAIVGDEGAPLLEGQATLSVIGQPAQPIYVGAAAVGDGLYDTNVVVVDARTAYIVLTANTSLAPGSYGGTLYVVACWDQACANHVSGSPIQVPYTVELRAVPALVRPVDQSFVADAGTVAADLQGSVSVAVTAGPARTWSATSSAAWLVLDATMGTTGDALTFHVETAALAAIPSGHVEQATVTIDVPSPGPLTTQFEVTLENRLPEIRFVAPSARLAGRANRVLARGIGFDAVADLSSVAVEGIAGVAVTRLSDTELSLDVPSAPAGAYRVHVPNALGIARSESQLRLVDGVSYSWASLPLAGDKRALLYDPVRRVLFLVNVTSERVYRYAYANGTWTPSYRDIAGLLDIGLAPDGSVLVATTSSGPLLLLDPDTLVDVATYPHTGTYVVNWLQSGVPVTNDGRAWLAFGSQWATLGYFDLTERAFANADVSGVSTSFYDGPWFSLSANGERMLLVQSAGISPTPPALYFDAIDAVLKVNPAGLTFFYEAAQSEDGRRMFLGSADVRDASFALVGTATIGADYFRRGGALSPDGTRAYVRVAPYYPGSPGVQPSHIEVFDSSAAPAGGADLPLLGTIALPEDVTCRTSGCYARTLSTMTPDGTTLFLAGDERLLVVPVPAL